MSNQKGAEHQDRERVGEELRFEIPQGVAQALSLVVPPERPGSARAA